MRDDPVTAKAQSQPIRLWPVALLVFTLITSVSLSVGSRLIPLGFVDGMADGGEWFDIGTSFATFGVIGSGLEPFVHRPPGYPVWIAGILRVAVDPRTHSQAAINIYGPIALRVADSVLLGLCGALSFSWLARRLRLLTAFAASILLGLNAYALVTATLIHYNILGWILFLGLVLLLDISFRRTERGAVRAFFLTGLFLGLATLVRPLTLLVPLGLLPVFLIRHPGRRFRRVYPAFVLGMILVITPWTLRNYMITGRVIPINVQGWTQLFASTSEVDRHDPDRYEWLSLTMRHALPIFQRVTGHATLDFDVYVKEIVPLEDAFREAAIRNIAAKPSIYLTNVWNAAIGLHRDVNAVILTAFTRVQSRDEFRRAWILVDSPTAMPRGPEAVLFQRLHDLLLLAAIFGLGVSVWRRDPFLAPAVALWASVAAVFALTYLDFFYYSTKMPFLVAFAFYGFDALPRAPRYGLIASISALSLGLSWSMGLLG